THPPPHDGPALGADHVGGGGVLPRPRPDDRGGPRSCRPGARHGPRVAAGPHRGRVVGLLTSRGKGARSGCGHARLGAVAAPLVLLIAFLVGAVPFSNIAAHMTRGVDLRAVG